jgi:hypothetical protein
MASKNATKKKQAAPRKAAAKKKVGKVMDEFKHGQLKSGGSGKKVTNRKQAIAIALSESGQSNKQKSKKKS